MFTVRNLSKNVNLQQTLTALTNGIMLWAIWNDNTRILKTPDNKHDNIGSKLG